MPLRRLRRLRASERPDDLVTGQLTDGQVYWLITLALGCATWTIHTACKAAQRAARARRRIRTIDTGARRPDNRHTHVRINP